MALSTRAQWITIYAFETRHFVLLSFKSLTRATLNDFINISAEAPAFVIPSPLLLQPWEKVCRRDSVNFLMRIAKKKEGRKEKDFSFPRQIDPFLRI